jgi:hypothetical protein
MLDRVKSKPAEVSRRRVAKLISYESVGGLVKREGKKNDGEA